jgi:hypothetical protein
MAEQGVCKFELQFTAAAPVVMEVTLRELNAWRSILWRLGLIGQDPQRYGGYGFGNVSQRIAPAGTPVQRRAFLISGTQTGALAKLDAAHYASVREYDVTANRVVAHGPVEPSSEALTHGMIYDLDDRIRIILHVHSPEIWEHAERLGIPVTDRRASYGTPAMAHEVERLFTEYELRQEGILSMGGHEDGIVAFGTSSKEAGCILLTALSASVAIAT